MPVPIERSMPPVTITKVVPRARIPMTAVESNTPEILLQERKLGLAREKKINKMMSVPKARDC
jgi:hypothetical protein